ncbi:MAG TPA: NAD(P)-dependent oxidoreductase [Solirubrobacteraceae bacterium]
MSRVLLTGASGFVGRHTLAPLLAGGFEVHAVTSGESGEPPLDAPAEVRWHRTDLLAAGAPAVLVGEVRPSHLLHLAWCTRPGVFWSTLENLDWVAASLALLRAFGEAGGRRAVVAGSCAEYAWQAETHCSESLTPLQPATLYGAAKHGLHAVARAWARQVGVALAWGRIFHLYGPHEPPGRLVSDVARALLRGEEARCTPGEQVRDFLYAPELGDAFAALLACEEVTGPVNLASGEPVRVAEVIAAIAAQTGRPELVRLGALPVNPGEPERLTADVRRLRDEVGWAPSLDLAQGAAWTVGWWRHELEGGSPEEEDGMREPEATP